MTVANQRYIYSSHLRTHTCTQCVSHTHTHTCHTHMHICHTHTSHTIIHTHTHTHMSHTHMHHTTAATHQPKAHSHLQGAQGQVRDHFLVRKFITLSRLDHTCSEGGMHAHFDLKYTAITVVIQTLFSMSRTAR